MDIFLVWALKPSLMHTSDGGQSGMNSTWTLCPYPTALLLNGIKVPLHNMLTVNEHQSQERLVSTNPMLFPQLLLLHHQPFLTPLLTPSPLLLAHLGDEQLPPTCLPGNSSLPSSLLTHSFRQTDPMSLEPFHLLLISQFKYYQQTQSCEQDFIIVPSKTLLIFTWQSCLPFSPPEYYHAICSLLFIYLLLRHCQDIFFYLQVQYLLNHTIIIDHIFQEPSPFCSFSISLHGFQQFYFLVLTITLNISKDTRGRNGSASEHETILFYTLLQLIQLKCKKKKKANEHGLQLHSCSSYHSQLSAVHTAMPQFKNATKTLNV